MWLGGGKVGVWGFGVWGCRDVEREMRVWFWDEMIVYWGLCCNMKNVIGCVIVTEKGGKEGKNSKTNR